VRVDPPGFRVEFSGTGLRTALKTAGVPLTRASAPAQSRLPVKVPQSGPSLRAVQRQQFEFGLRIATGAFKWLVEDMLGLVSATLRPSVTDAAATRAEPASQVEVVKSITRSPAIQLRAAVKPLQAEPPAIALLRSGKSATAYSETGGASVLIVHSERAQAVFVHPRVLAQAATATPVPAVAVSEISRSAPLQQYDGHRQDIFEVQATIRRHAPGKRHLDRFG